MSERRFAGFPSRHRYHLLALVLALLFSYPSSAQDRILLDRILVVVNGQPITQSRLNLYRAYLEHTGWIGLGWPKAFEPLERLQEEQLLEVVVLDELLFAGASQSDVVAVRPTVVTSRVERFQQSFAGRESYDAFLARNGLTSELLSEFFYRRVRVEGYIAFKLGLREPDDLELAHLVATWSARYPLRPMPATRAALVYEWRVLEAASDFERWTAKVKEGADVREPTRSVTK